MASGQNLSDMEQSPIKSPTSAVQRSTCEQQAYAKSQIERMIRIQSYKLAIVEDLKKYPDYEEDHFYQNALMELQDIENSMQLAVSDFDSFPSCTTPGCSFHDLPPTTSPFTTPKNSPKVSPIKTNSKRKDSDEFQLPRKTTKRSLFDQPSTCSLQISPNKYSALANCPQENPDSAPKLPLASPRRHWPLAPSQQALMRHSHRTLCHLL
ncbi:hypothetical protein TNCT_418691 [Trichonephila clavata]|uniref:Uncharacterized protein n=1 Tax=Trichonephila clavata TaxID=2740835 RepID=A0A8X6JCJ7_TRICU|nr:hypothetical protein TNCT_418691 [Trichonephila clavata]